MGETALTEAERLELAADMALRDGDVGHWRELIARAQYARRRARERAAGVRNYGYGDWQRYDRG